MGAPKTHFSGLSLIRNLRRFANVSSRSAMSPSDCLVFMRDSSVPSLVFRPGCDECLPTPKTC